MNKLQLYIYKSLRGFRSIRNINPSENIQRHISDLRTALDIIEYDSTEKYLFYMVSYIAEGTFFTILRTIPDKPLDHLSTTIFVPNGLEISAGEMSEIVKRTTRMISNQSVSAEDLAELHEIFAKEYPFDAKAPSMAASEGAEYAFCRYGGTTGRTLTSFFGEMLYQPEYIKYVGVVLFDEELGVKSDAVDLTPLPMQQTVALLPPEGNSDGFVPYIYNRPFDCPFLAPLGGEITIKWRRNGFEEQTQVILVEGPDMLVEAIPTNDSRKTISPASFSITSQSSKVPISGATIVVNGVEITEARAFTQDELKNAEVLIKASGYSPFRSHINLAATTQALVQLQEQRKVYRFELPVNTSELGDPIRFEIHTKREMSDSPIEGYSLLDDMREGATRINHLQYVAPRKVSRLLLIILPICALLLGLSFGWLLFSTGTDEMNAAAEQEINAKPTVVVEPKFANLNTDATQPVVINTIAVDSAQTAPTVVAPVDTSAHVAVAPATSMPIITSAEAIAYLDSNKAWTREGLDKFPELGGLFDDLNNYRFRRIISVWEPLLEESKNFKKVARAAREGTKKKKFKYKEGGTYCPPGDNTITWLPYTYRIDP